MIVEIGGGNSGFAEYLEKGLKQGRLFSRDELDQRIVLDGDLELTDKIINSIADNGQERYLHITLSFREDEISNDLLQSITTDYKLLLMSAYSDDEFNFYAEAHLPKIKSIEDSKTGKMIERKPHIHIVIPEINLLSGNKLLPTGYTDNVNVKNIPYLDSIQEYINYKYNLESPKDFMREGGHHSANVLSRIKGDFFGEKQSKFKAQLVDEISSGKINSLESFQRRLSDFGEVKIRNKGKPNEYFAVKLPDDKKFTNLQHPVFSERAIVTKALPKPDLATINTRLEDWQNRVSKEIKFVDFATPSFRQQYAKADLGEKAQLLIEREQNYERKHRQSPNLDTARGRKRNHQSNASTVNRGKSNVTSRASVSVSSVQSGVMVRGTSQRGERTQGILPENELNYLRNGKSSINPSLRWNDSGGRRGNASGRGIGNKPPISTRAYAQIASGVPKQTYQKNIFDKSIDSRPFVTPFERYQNQYSDNAKIAKFSHSNALSSLINERLNEQVKQAEITKYADIRRNIDPNAFLSHLEKVYSIDPKKHKVSYAKDGSPRFNVGKRNLNASDFLTKHLNLQWHEAKSVLHFCYENQHNKNINQERLAYEQMKSNIKAFDSELRQFEKLTKVTLHNMNVDNRNAFREEKKRIYARQSVGTKIRNQELAIASFRCMQRQELIDEFAKNSSSFIVEAKQYFQQSGYSIKSLEEIDMATKAGQKLQELQGNSIAPAETERETEKKGLFERVFDKVREQTPLNQENAQFQQNQHAKDIYATQSGEEVGTDYRGNIQFKNLALQESLKKNNIGVAKHTDGKIEYKSLTDGKLICTDDGDKMKIHQKDMSPENVKFFLEVSIDRYGNELQINGKKEFKDLVVEAAAANNLPVILKPAELQEQLIARRKELEMEQKVEVNSIEKAAPEQTQEKAKDEQHSSIEPAQSKSAANDEFKQPQVAEPLKSVQEQPQATTEKAQTKAESSKTTERPAYTIEFKYDESAKKRTAQESAVIAGRFYSVKVNGVPVQEAMKNDPNIAKVLENAAKNSPDLKAKNITADNLKSGHILGLQTSNVGTGKFDKPETLKLNGAGQQISTPKAQAEKSAGVSKGKSSDISL
ncbi:LPD7 domain-containing protein [Avibacterium endocarditidis]|uniref:LPD7 domain-containing protein n=1 Tax=Avibacterium endocarditidis TaxID=380674 RepID=UPI0039FD3365